MVVFHFTMNFIGPLSTALRQCQYRRETFSCTWLTSTSRLHSVQALGPVPPAYIVTKEPTRWCTVGSFLRTLSISLILKYKITRSLGIITLIGRCNRLLFVVFSFITGLRDRKDYILPKSNKSPYLILSAQTSGRRDSL